MIISLDVLANTFTILVCLCLGLIAFFDFLYYRIPNKILIVMVGLFCLWSLTQTGYNFINHVAIAAAFIFIGIILAHFKIVGSGDSKLLAVVSLWLSGTQILKMLVLMAIFGGVLALYVRISGFGIHALREKLWNILFIRTMSRAFIHDLENTKANITFDRYHNMVPYGIAIAIATIFVLYSDIIRWKL